MSAEKRPLVFPDIARWSRPRGKYIKLEADQTLFCPDEEPPLNGIPQSQSQSVFWNHAIDTAWSLMDIQQEPGHRKRAKKMRTAVDPIFPDRQLFLHTLEYLKDSVPDDKKNVATNALMSVQQSLLEYTQEHDLSGPENFGTILLLYKDFPDQKEQTLSILKEALLKRKDIPSSVDYFYDFMTAVYQISDPLLDRFALDVMCYKTSLLLPFSIQSQLFSCGEIYDKDDTLGKALDVQEGIKWLTDEYDTDYSLENNRTRVMKKETVSPYYAQLTQEIEIRDVDRMEKLRRYHEKNSEDALIIMDDTNSIVHSDFPIRVTQQNRELRLLINQKVIKDLKDRDVDGFLLFLPDDTHRFMLLRTPHDNNDPGIRALYDVINQWYLEVPGEYDLTDPRTRSTFFEYLKPLFCTPEELDKLHQNRDALQSTIEQDVKRWISPYGHEVLMDRDSAETFGIDELVFKPSKNGNVNVFIKSGNSHTRVKIENRHPLYSVNFDDAGINPPLSDFARYWWESMILYYFKGIVCSQESEIGLVGCENDSPSENLVYQAESPHRKYSAHRRRLPKNRQYTQEQHARALSEIGIDLEVYNRIRGLTRETGTYTWVLPEPPKNPSEFKPIVVHASLAPKIYKGIIPRNT